MTLVYKVLFSAEHSPVGGRSIAFPRHFPHRLSYRKDEPAAGRYPLFAFEDLPSAHAFASDHRDRTWLTIWEAEAPEVFPAPRWVPEFLDGGFNAFPVDYYWSWAKKHVSPVRQEGESEIPDYWSARQAGVSFRAWYRTPAGTVLAPSLTLRRLVADPLGDPALGGPDSARKPPVPRRPYEEGASQGFKQDQVLFEQALIPAAVFEMDFLAGLSVTQHGFEYAPGPSLATVPAEISRLRRLQVLNLSWNTLRALPSEIGQLSQLRRLDLHMTQLQDLPAEIGSLSRLCELDLAATLLTALPRAIGQLSALEQLDLRWTHLRELPEEIWQLPNLKVLRLGGEELTPLPESALEQLKHLREVDLSATRLTQFPAGLATLPHLHRLHLNQAQARALGSPREALNLPPHVKIGVWKEDSLAGYLKGRLP